MRGNLFDLVAFYDELARAQPEHYRDMAILISQIAASLDDALLTITTSHEAAVFAPATSPMKAVVVRWNLVARRFVVSYQETGQRSNTIECVDVETARNAALAFLNRLVT